MSQDDQQGDEKKKRGFPGSFLVFLLVAVLIALTVQNFLSTKHANVSFSYQVPHLVNLQLVNPADSRMTALNDNLVTFSGRFREKVTPEGKSRFKYLELLDRQDVLEEQRGNLLADLKQDRQMVLSSAAWFLRLSGTEVPQEGFKVQGMTPGAPEAGQSLVVTSVERGDLVSLRALEERLATVGQDGSEKTVKAFGGELALLIQHFRSPALGIGSESIKQELRTLETEVKGATGTAALTTFASAIDSLKGIVAQLDEPVEGTRLSQLRSVRNYNQTLGDYQTTLVELTQAELQLDQAREPVSGVLWFYAGKELSTRALERQDSEGFNQWFQQAKQEWDQFSVNKALPFRAVDQPRNLVLERTFKSEAPAPNYVKYLPMILLMGLLVMLLYFVFSRQMKGGASGAMAFGKSPAKMLGKGMTNVTFKDVAGCEEAKEELEEVVEFLRNPQKFTTLGGRIPKGVLCVGPPGTGKTLIAKAVAGEASRPFFSISGSDFVEMFVGVGASRIRDLFAQAKKHAPCIIFIDEIDAVGRHRGGGYGGGHDEREQTLNQLLVEMDGFDTNEGVILMAATNRPDVLDKALLRPGRFDRRVTIDLPDVKGRLAILNVHARRIKIDPQVDLMAIAKMTPGASGADLENLLNEAALLAARKGRTAVTAAETLEAADKVRFGKERRSLEISDEEKRTTAYHESGHAIVGWICEYSDPVDKVTIIPRGFSLGATHFLPEKNRLNYWKKEIYDHLAVAMGGRVAEEIFVGDVSSGAQQDITMASSLARSMVCEWGMSDELGLVSYGERSGGGQFLGMPGGNEKNYSDETAQAIDEAVRNICADAHKRAYEIVESHKEQVELMTSMLMEFETLDRADLQDIMDGTWDAEKKQERLANADKLHRKVETDEETPDTPAAPISTDPKAELS